MPPLDLTTESGVVALVSQCKSRKDWNNATQQVKEANGGRYPDFWYATVVDSGLASRIGAQWGEYMGIQCVGIAHVK